MVATDEKGAAVPHHIPERHPAGEPLATCLVCKRRPPSLGVLCAECQAGLSDRALLPSHIECAHAIESSCYLVDGYGRPLPLAETTTVGRKECEIRIHRGEVSRAHAQFRLEDRGWTLRDLGSRNGTALNGAVVTDAVIVSHGDRVRFGRTQFYFAVGHPRGEELGVLA